MMEHGTPGTTAETINQIESEVEQMRGVEAEIIDNSASGWLVVQFTVEDNDESETVSNLAKAYDLDFCRAEFENNLLVFNKQVDHHLVSDYEGDESIESIGMEQGSIVVEYANPGVRQVLLSDANRYGLDEVAHWIQNGNEFSRFREE